MPDKLKFIKDLLTICFIPELQQDLDTIPIDSESFKEFQKNLVENLPILYDFVQQNETWIISDKEKEVEEVYASLIILFCEITTNTGAPYKIKEENLLKNANRLLSRYEEISSSVDDIMFEHYCNKLKKNIWKRQIGTVHSLMRFLEFRHNEISRHHYKMSLRWLKFCLSFGLNVRECHEPVYKQIGTRIFQVILNYGNKEEIQELNIHGVIYDDVFKDIPFMDNIVATADVWSCLYKCLEFYNDLNSIHWSCVDDMLAALIRNIALTSDALISLCMLKFITKLCSYFSANHMEIDVNINTALNNDMLLQQTRGICSQNNSYTKFRWAKNILKTFISESYRLKQSTNICRQLLQEMHRCYMVCILPISLEVIEKLLIRFFKEIMPILMEVIVINKYDANIVQIVKNFIETFLLQLQRDRYCDENETLCKYREGFQKLLQQNIFLYRR